MKKALIGLAIVPLLPALLWMPLMVMYQAVTTDVDNPLAYIRSGLSEMNLGVFLAGLKNSYIVAVVGGFPLYLLLVKVRFLRLWVMALIGLLLPVLAMSAYQLYQLLSQPTSTQGSSSTVQALVSVLQQNMALLVAYGVASLVAVCVLWLFVRGQGDSETIQLDDEWEVTEKL